MNIEIHHLGFSVLVMLISTGQGVALECIRCSYADDGERDHGEDNCDHMPYAPCNPPGTDWMAVCAKVEGMLTAYYSPVQKVRVIMKRICIQRKKNPLTGDTNHKCFQDNDALGYLTPFTDKYPVGSSFKYNGTICFCNDRDNCNGAATLQWNNWIIIGAITTALVLCLRTP